MNILDSSEEARAKGRQYATRAAGMLKAKDHGDKKELKIGFAFDDAVVTVNILTSEIRRMEEPQLAEYLYQLIAMATDTDASTQARPS